MTPKKGRKKKWLIVAMAAVLGGVTAATQAGIAPTEVADLLVLVADALAPAEAPPEVASLPRVDKSFGL